MSNSDGGELWELLECGVILEGNGSMLEMVAK